MVNPDVIPDDFPAWMHPRHRGINWGLVIAGLIGLAVGWAFFVRSGIPAVTTGTHVAFMASDFASALREGVPVPLWSPHVLNGYGAPVPQFTPQGAAYLAALVEVFFTDNTAEALRLVMVVSMAAAAMGMYTLTTALGLHWGIVAAALYVLSPFVGLTTPHVLVDPALMMSHAFLPYLIWMSTQMTTGGEKRAVVLTSAMVLGAFGFIEPHVALTGWLGGLVLVWMTGERGALVRWLGVGLAGLGICSPLWLPTLMLSNQVIWLPSGQPSAYSVSVWEWWTPLKSSGSDPQFTMGTLLPLMMVVAWIYQLRGGGHWRILSLGTVGVVTTGLGCLLFPASWWLSVGSFWAAAAGAGGLAVLDKWVLPSHRHWARISATASLFTLSLPILIVPFGAATTDFSPTAQIRYEQRAHSTALLPSGYAIPSALSAIPVTNPLLISSYETGTPNRIPMSGGARVSVLHAGSQSNSWQIGMAAGGKLQVAIAYFPGWFATLDERPVPLARQAENGLMQVTLPPTSNGILRIEFGLTPSQIVAWLTVLLTGIGLGVYARKP